MYSVFEKVKREGERERDEGGKERGEKGEMKINEKWRGGETETGNNGAKNEMGKNARLIENQRIDKGKRESQSQTVTTRSIWYGKPL